MIESAVNLTEPRPKPTFEPLIAVSTETAKFREDQSILQAAVEMNESEFAENKDLLMRVREILDKLDGKP